MARQKMDPRIKQEWLKRLRSGQYVQGRMELRQLEIGDDGLHYKTHCCLGVLLEIAKDERPKGVGVGTSAFKNGNLTPKAMNWAKLDRTTTQMLAGKNDGDAYDGTKPWSFKKIAGWIERYL